MTDPKDIVQSLDQLRDAAIRAHDSVDPRRLRTVMLAEYRCPVRGCLLLHAWQSPAGVLFYRPAYKIGREMNLTESSESGRARNTTDGENHWKPQAGLLDTYRDVGWREGVRITLRCDHVNVAVHPGKIIRDIDAAEQPGKAVRRVVRAAWE